MKRKLLATLICVAMTGSLLAGCGGSSSSTSDSSDSSAAAEDSADEESTEDTTEDTTDASSGSSDSEAVDSSEITTPTEEGNWVIGFSNYSVGNSWRQQMEAEFEQEADALKEAGVISDYTMLNADNDQSKQISDIRDLITMGCDAIVVTAITSDGLNDVLEEAVDDGIVVVNFDNMSSSTKLTSKVTVSDYDFGRLCGEWLGEQLPDGGNVIELNGTAGTSTDTNRAKGMEEGLAATSPDCDIVASVNADWDYATAKTAVEELLNTYPEIDGVLSQGGAMTQAAMEAFEAAGRDLVPMTGEASNGFLRSWVEAKDQGFTSIAFVCPTTQSSLALDVAVNALNGEDVAPEYLASEDPVTEDNVESVYRPDLSDNYWPAGTNLNETTVKEMFAE
mgnify:CR=1 FL=1